MARFFLIFGVLPSLTACAVLETGRDGSAPWASSAAGPYDFAWQLSGDQAVAPLQVFDDGRQTWLQFSPGQAVPALFAQTAAGEQPLPYVRRDPYVVIDGKWPTLRFRGGHLKALAHYRGAASPALQVPETAPEPAPLSAMPEVTPAATPVTSQTLAAKNPSANTDIAGIAPRFHAGPPDDTLRAVLSRWAKASGWTFLPQHWAADVDIPLAGTAEFPADFKVAVRELLAATELAERPLQPCFYTNQVLRVVPLAQSCDRSAHRAGGLS